MVNDVHLSKSLEISAAQNLQLPAFFQFTREKKKFGGFQSIRDILLLLTFC